MGLRISRRAAFTLVELLMVIIIIALLAAIGIPKFRDSSGRAREATMRQELHWVRDAVAKFQADCSGWPTSLADLASPTAPATVLSNSGTAHPLNASKYRGPYLSKVPVSPIKGGTYVYIDDNDEPKPIGTVFHSAGTALDGSNYSSW
jgi:general secretion pathway protein G